MALRYTPVVDDQLLLVTRLCEQFFCTKNTFLTVSLIRKLAIIKKQEYLIRTHCVRLVKYVMQRISRERLLQSITADSLLAPKFVFRLKYFHKYVILSTLLWLIVLLKEKNLHHDRWHIEKRNLRRWGGTKL